ncbi:MAG: hypothetical protein QXH20_07345 [Candidatus Bathyarchaeia archaeon]
MRTTGLGLWNFVLINLAKDSNDGLILYDDLPETVRLKLDMLAQQPNALRVIQNFIADKPPLDLLIERILLLT